MYSLIKPLLFLLPEEISHELTLDSLAVLNNLKLTKLIAPAVHNKPEKCMGLNFKNPLGLAAGLDKNGDYINALAKLGFGFIEIGTVTPEPQSGNALPRLFRLPQYQALINRMGFNNKGVNHLVDNVKKAECDLTLGINIGKNASTPVENAIEDYRYCLARVYPYADYVTINISSPNTQGLRQLQFGNMLNNLLSTLKYQQKELSKKYKKYVPLAVKIAPDMSNNKLEELCKVLINLEIDAVIATNTTIQRPISNHKIMQQTGGLSGAPLAMKSNEIIKSLASYLPNNIPIIGVGGILNAQDAAEKVSLGANLLQIYSGLIYKGPALVTEALDGIYSAQENQTT